MGSTALAVWLYRLWYGDFGVPWTYSGDAFQNGMLFKAVVEDGDIWNNDRLGAPFVQHFQDWPLTDLLPLYLGKLLSLLTTNWAALLNAVYLLTFPSVALAAWWVMRKLGVSSWPACALSIIYAVAPYHFARGEAHFFLSGYYGVPLGVWLALSILRGEELFPRRSGATGPLAVASWGTLRTAVLCAVIALSSVYYMTFTVVMLLAVAVVNVVGRHWRRAVTGGVVIALMAGAFLVAATPTLLYRAENGPNVLGAGRSASDTEAYGLKLSQVLLPAAWHRIDALAELRQRYVSEFPVPSESTATAAGTAAAIGLVWLIGYGLFGLATGGIRRQNDRHRELSFLALVLIFVATVGGAATLVSLLLTSQVRGWNRVSIVLSFLALCALGLLLDRAAARWHLLRKTFVAAPCLALAVLVAGYDQFSPAFGFPYEDNEREFRADAAFFAGIEEVLPTGAAVFQVPRTTFPEPLQLQYVDMDAYDPMRPYLHTHDLRWSYGGIEGRAEYEWQRRLETMSTVELLEAITAAGFQGLYVDRYGYTDRAARFESEVTLETSAEPIVSAGGRQAFFDLRPYAERVRAADPRRAEALRDDLLFPVVMQVSGRKYRHEIDNGEPMMWAPEDVALPVVNESDDRQTAHVTFELRPGTGRRSTFILKWPDGSTQTVVSGEDAVRVSHTFVALPGRSDIHIDSDAAAVDPGDLIPRNFKVLNMDISPAPVP